MTTGTYILGTGLSHDGSSCLMKDGEIIVGIEKERITRKKHDGLNDSSTLQYCLDAAGITWNDIHLVVENNTKNQFEVADQKERGSRIIPASVSVVGISHHLAHAYSAFGPSPFDEATAIVMDGCGSSLDNCSETEGEIPIGVAALSELERPFWWEKESVYSFRNNKCRPVFKDFSPLIPAILDRENYPMAPNTVVHSIAEFYGGVTKYVFDSDWAQGKLMGLAPYGRPNMIGEIPFVFSESRVFLKYDWMHKFPFDKLGKFYQNESDFQFYADIAYWAQKETESAILYLVGQYYDLAPSANVAYAGGLALNAVANARIIRESPFENVYIQPAAGDSGIALGCCYYGWMEVLGRERVRHNGGCCFGRRYTLGEIRESLAGVESNVIVDEFVQDNNLVDEAARLLATGNTIGWFQGGSEFGPRALGHRSILADPRDSSMWQHINRSIKFREDFRPFAPAVTQESASKFFDCDYESPYMILTAPVRMMYRGVIPAVTHRDGSARLQTVSVKDDPGFHKLLCAFGRHTGVPILLNTSLNWRGMPIAETPADALELFLNSELDVMMIENVLIRKKSS